MHHLKILFLGFLLASSCHCFGPDVDVKVLSLDNTVDSLAFGGRPDLELGRRLAGDIAVTGRIFAAGQPGVRIVRIVTVCLSNSIPGFINYVRATTADTTALSAGALNGSCAILQFISGVGRNIDYTLLIAYVRR